MGDTKFRQAGGRRTAQGPYRSDERLRKREEGDVRNAEWRAMTVRERMVSLAGRRGNSVRQMRRLRLVQSPTTNTGAQSTE